MSNDIIAWSISALIFVFYLICAFFTISGRKIAGHTSFTLFKTFAGSFLFAVVIYKILPELPSMKEGIVPLLILMGFLFQVIIESISMGVEHGHSILGEGFTSLTGILIGILMHSFGEALPIANSHTSYLYPYITGIILHKIPMILVLSLLVNSREVKLARNVLVATLFATSFISGFYAGKILNINQEYLIAFASGIMLQIGSTNIYEHLKEHKFSIPKIGAITLAILLVLII